MRVQDGGKPGTVPWFSLPTGRGRGTRPVAYVSEKAAKLIFFLYTVNSVAYALAAFFVLFTNGPSWMLVITLLVSIISLLGVLPFRRLVTGTRTRNVMARGLVGLAGSIAGKGRADLRADWNAVVKESPDSAVVRTTFGMVVAAVRLRAADLSEVCWRPVDAVLKSRPLSGAVVIVPTITTAWILLRHSGGAEMLGHAEALAAVAGACRLLITAGRKWRGVNPPEHKVPPQRR